MAPKVATAKEVKGWPEAVVNGVQTLLNYSGSAGGREHCQEKMLEFGSLISLHLIKPINSFVLRYYFSLRMHFWKLQWILDWCKKSHQMIPWEIKHTSQVMCLEHRD